MTRSMIKENEDGKYADKEHPTRADSVQHKSRWCDGQKYKSAKSIYRT